MRPTLLPLLACAALSAWANPAGPAHPPIKGASQAPTAPIWVAYGVKATLRNLPGASVTVEDTLPDLQPLSQFLRPFSAVSLRLKGGDLLPDRRISPVPDWLNPGVIMSGPNVLQRTYAFVGANF